jgi:hypothetical protein
VYDLDEINLDMAIALNKLWLNNVSSKVSLFGWRLLLEKFSTREALFCKDIINNNNERCCVFCFTKQEEINHIFFTCSVTIQVWQCIFRWLGTRFLLFEDIFQHFTVFGEIAKGKNSKLFRHIIWLAMTWSICRTRNNIFFRGDCVNITSLVDQIIYISWLWFIGRSGNNFNLVFSDWCNNPLDCFQCI